MYVYLNIDGILLNTLLGNICFLYFKNIPWTYFHNSISKILAEEFYALAKLWHIHIITYCVNTVYFQYPIENAARNTHEHVHMCVHKFVCACKYSQNMVQGLLRVP